MRKDTQIFGIKRFKKTFMGIDTGLKIWRFEDFSCNEAVYVIATTQSGSFPQTWELRQVISKRVMENILIDPRTQKLNVGVRALRV